MRENTQCKIHNCHLSELTTKACERKCEDENQREHSIMNSFTSFTIIGRSDHINQGIGPSESSVSYVTISKRQTPLPERSTGAFIAGSSEVKTVDDQSFHNYPRSGSDEQSFMFPPAIALSVGLTPISDLSQPSRAAPDPPVTSSSTTAVSTQHSPLPLATTADIDNLSPYQCFLREQIELFETNEDYLSIKAQGRNNPIELGQVGIRCRHCAVGTHFTQLKTSAIQYSMSINGIYQVALKMGRAHFNECRLVPDKIKKRLLELREQPRKRARGRKYWKETLEAQGLIEDGNRLRFHTTEASHSNQE